MRGAAPAERWLVDGGPGTVGIVASVTRPFCGACDRVRLTADGQVRNCLFARDESDLRSALRAGASDGELAVRWRAALAGKKAGHGIDDPSFLQPTRPMSAIGGLTLFQLLAAADRPGGLRRSLRSPPFAAFPRISRLAFPPEHSVGPAPEPTSIADSEAAWRNRIHYPLKPGERSGRPGEPHPRPNGSRRAKRARPRLPAPSVLSRRA